MELDGKIVVVTGALGALGKAVSERCASEGAQVALCFRGELSRFHDAFTDPPTSLHPFTMDIYSEESITTTLSAITGTLGPIDIVINCAGITHTAPFVMTKNEEWLSILDTNMGGVQRVCSAIAPAMMARRKGSIINISSLLGQTLGRGSAAYAASKAAINRFTEVAAEELGKKGVRINAVAPGFLEGGMAKTMVPQAVEKALQRTPLNRKGKISEVVEAVLFLASERASYITGQILHVDGGASCG